MMIRFLPFLNRFRAVRLRISPVGLIFAAALAIAVNGYSYVTDQFIRLTTFPTGGSPQAIASADFDRDGKADVAVLNGNGVLSVLLGTGNSTFAAAKAVATHLNPTRFLLAADFNGDGNQDLLRLIFDTIIVYPGHGDGSFGAPVAISVGLSSPGNIAIGDFNGDLRPDVVVANRAAIAVLLGKSGGYLQGPLVTTTGVSPEAMALGDVNRDGHLDVVVTDPSIYDVSATFQVLLGSGNGTFYLGTLTSIETDFPPTVLAIADFNLDGKPDLAVGMQSQPAHFLGGRVCLLSGNGDGTFDHGLGNCFSAPDNYSQMLVTDLNGNPGLVFASDPFFSYPFYVLTTSGPGKSSESTCAAGGGPVTLGDFNGDGRQDVIAANAQG